MDNHDSKPSPRDLGWEREVIEKLAFAALDEQRRQRRWSVFFKLLMFGYLLLLGAILLYPRFEAGIADHAAGHTAVVDVVGMIAEGQPANAEDIIDSMRAAIKDPNTRGLILNANSPGGSPVQSHYIYDEIRRIKKERPELPVHAVVSDICASGCYYAVAAADKVFVNQASLIGSIGVLMDGFGFVGAMQKLGVERRLMTAGEHKGILDPFSPPKADEQRYMQTLLDQVHQQFITAVKEGRGQRLKPAPEVFSGLVWTGESSIALGLADDYGSEVSVAKDVIGAERRVNYTRRERLLDRLAGQLGAALGRRLDSGWPAPPLR